MTKTQKILIVALIANIVTLFVGGIQYRNYLIRSTREVTIKEIQDNFYNQEVVKKFADCLSKQYLTVQNVAVIEVSQVAQCTSKTFIK